MGWLWLGEKWLGVVGEGGRSLEVGGFELKASGLKLQVGVGVECGRVEFVLMRAWSWMWKASGGKSI
jgi:hypothetical protein